MASKLVNLLASQVKLLAMASKLVNLLASQVNLLAMASKLQRNTFLITSLLRLHIVDQLDGN